MSLIILKTFVWVDNNYYRFSKLFALFAGSISIFAICILLSEMTTRNLGNPVHWLYEASGVTVVWIFLLPLAFSQMSGGMIRITFLIDKMPLKARPWLNLLGSLAAVVLGIFFLIASLSYLIKVNPEGFVPYIFLPTYVQRGIIPVCASFLLIAALICTVRDILMLVPSMKEKLARTKYDNRVTL